METLAEGFDRHVADHVRDTLKGSEVMSKAGQYFDRVGTALSNRGWTRVGVDPCEGVFEGWSCLSIGNHGTIRFEDSDFDADIGVIFEWSDSIEVEISVSVFGTSSSWELRGVHASGETVDKLSHCLADLARIVEIAESVGDGSGVG